ncbi:MAG: OmpA family protein [Halobacteriovoraceae bacterium]|nr:OmpA family protein [Halobacteriovoraceae bacterium]
MKIKYLPKSSLVVFFLLLISSRVFAINLQSYTFSDSYRYSLIEESLMLKHPGNWVLTSSLAYINEPLVQTNAAQDQKLGVIIDNFKVLSLGFSYYLARWMSIGAEAYVINSTLSDDNTLIAQAEAAESLDIKDGTNIGDFMIKSNIRLLRLKESKFAISVIPKIYFPTGDNETFTSDDEIRWSVLGVMEKIWTRWGFQFAAGYSYAKDAIFDIIDYEQLFNIQMGAYYRITSDWNINFEMTRAFSLSNNDTQDTGDYYATTRVAVHPNFDLHGGLGVAGFNEVDRGNLTVFAGLKFHAAKEKRERVSRPKIVEPPPIIESREQEKQLGTLFKADRVYFPNSSSLLDKRARASLDEVANYLKENELQVSKVIIEGYASKVGPHQYNQILSDARSKKVLDYLVSLGANPELLQTVAYGDDYLNEEKDHALNRRVEFRIYLKKENLDYAPEFPESPDDEGVLFPE